MKLNHNRLATISNYHIIWKQFNAFLIRLDIKPKFWEERVALYCAHLMEKGTKSSTMSSYISAIKAILRADNYEWSESRVVFSSLVRACKLNNDIIKPRLPIHIGMLEILLFEIDRIYSGTQPYLQSLYKAVLCLGYYGLLRIREMAIGSHSILAKIYILI